MARRRLDDLNYYELLRVERGASADAIKRAFHRFARKYHPDSLVADGKELLRRTKIYRRGTEAYRVLIHPERRRLYDTGLTQGLLRFDPGQARSSVRPSMPPGFAQVSNPRARSFVLMAERALRQGDLQQAKLNFQIALSHEPDNAELQAKLAEAGARLKGG